MTHLNCFIAIAVLLTSAGARSSEEEPIEEIAVLATRRAADIGTISTAVSTSGRDAVVASKLATDALADMVGVTLQQTTPGQGAAIVRGLKGSAILHLVDGMRLSNAMFRSAPTPWFALVPATSIEHIEVIRGTPASLYGSEAVGGVVQAVSRLPEFETDTWSSAGEVVVGFDTAELLKSVRATLDAGDRRLSGSIGTEYLETGNRRVGGGQRIGPTGYRSRAVRAVLRGTPSAVRSWLVDVHFLEQPETPRIDELVPGYGETEPASSEFLFRPNSRTFVHLQHEQVTTAGIDWKVDAAWQRIDDDRTTRDFDAPERRLEDNRSDLYGLTINASGSRGTLSWIAGVDVYHDKVRSARREQDIATGTLATAGPRFPNGATIAQAGLFARADWNGGENHLLSAGLRYTDVDIELPDGTNITPGRVSGDLGWIFDINHAWQIVANFGLGFRAPNIADLGTLGNRPGNRFNVPNSTLGAETVTHLDTGVRYHGTGWHLEVVTYGLRYENRIVSVDTGGTTSDGRDIVQSVNAASSRLYGLEAGLNAALSNRLQLQATLNYTRGAQRIEDTTEPADRVPPLHGRLAISFTQSDTWTYGAWLVAAASQDRLSSRDVRDARIDPDGTAGWADVGASARWASQGGWQVVMSIDNMADRRYRVHGSGIDAPGRNVSLTVRRRW